MHGRGVRIGALVALVVLGLLVGLLVSRPSNQLAVQVNSPLLGSRAPAVTEATLTNTKISLASLRGRVVVLSFFASWCAACHDEAPELTAYASHLDATRERATILGVVYNDDNAAVASFAQGAGMTFPVLTDPGGRLANDLAVDSPPATIVLNRTGHVAAVLQGAVTTKQLETITTNLLEQPA
jgi:peroxiredoxin